MIFLESPKEAEAANDEVERREVEVEIETVNEIVIGKSAAEVVAAVGIATEKGKETAEDGVQLVEVNVPEVIHVAREVEIEIEKEKEEDLAVENAIVVDLPPENDPDTIDLLLQLRRNYPLRREISGQSFVCN